MQGQKCLSAPLVSGIVDHPLLHSIAHINQTTAEIVHLFLADSMLHYAEDYVGHNDVSSTTTTVAFDSL